VYRSKIVQHTSLSASASRLIHDPLYGLTNNLGLFLLLDVHAADRAGDHELLDLGGALEDVVDHVSAAR
jgi:hypothetical protein